MKLHEDKEEFIDSIVAISNLLQIPVGLIEKDYYVFYLLKELNKEIPGLLFKGGTCLSSAFHIIERFSEDIDLTLDNSHFGRGKNIAANHKIIEVCDRLGLKIINREKVEYHSHSNFNRYLVEYPVIYKDSNAKPYIQIELVFFQKAYPSEVKEVNSLISEHMKNEKYELQSFSICVQSLARTFVDKVFAICDYYERNETRRNSRHVYDLFKIFDSIGLDNEHMKELIESVRLDRKKSTKAVSAQDGYDINLTLKRIKETEFYKEDFETITKAMLIKKVDYNEIITVIDRIIESKLFNN